MNSITHIFLGDQGNNNLYFPFHASRIYSICLKKLGILKKMKIGMFFELLTILKMVQLCAECISFVKGGIMQKEPLALRQTIKRGIILYCMLALVAVPSGICSHQHRIPDFEIHALTQVLTEYDIPTIQDVTEHHAQMGLNPPAVDPVSAVLDGQNQDIEQEIEELIELPPFHEHIMQAAQNYKIDPALIRAIIQAESSYNPQAVSKRGAQGLMQLMPGTAKSLGIEDSFNPALNIDGGVRYFRQLLDRFGGDEVLALAAYNAGSRYVRKYKGVPPFRATKIYIKKVFKYRDQFGKEIASLNKLESAS